MTTKTTEKSVKAEKVVTPKAMPWRRFRGTTLPKAAHDYLKTNHNETVTPSELKEAYHKGIETDTAVDWMIVKEGKEGQNPFTLFHGKKQKQAIQTLGDLHATLVSLKNGNGEVPSIVKEKSVKKEVAEKAPKAPVAKKEVSKATTKAPVVKKAAE